MSKEFEIRREVELPGTAQQVFDAVTGGIAGWMFPVEGAPTAPGTGPEGSTVVWEPSGHFAIRIEGPDGWFNALDYLIEGRDGGSAVLRYVHSGVLSDDWEGEYDGASTHTDFYLHSLGEYLGHFAGRPVTYVAAPGPQASVDAGAVDVLRKALGIDSGADAIGQHVRVEVPGFGTVDGIVDYANQHFVGLRSDDALYRFYGRFAFGGTLDAAHHLFRPGADGEAATAAWSAWLEDLYA